MSVTTYVAGYGVDTTPSAGYSKVLYNGETQFVGGNTANERIQAASIAVDGVHPASSHSNAAPVPQQSRSPVRSPPSTPVSPVIGEKRPPSDIITSSSDSTDSSKKSKKGLDVDWGELEKDLGIMVGGNLIYNARDIETLKSFLPRPVDRVAQGFERRISSLMDRAQNGGSVVEEEAPLLEGGGEAAAGEASMVIDVGAGAEATGGLLAEGAVAAVGVEGIAAAGAAMAAAAPVALAAAGAAAVGYGAYEAGKHIKWNGETLNQHLGDSWHQLERIGGSFKTMSFRRGR
jgi:hypothetical protein